MSRWRRLLKRVASHDAFSVSAAGSVWEDSESPAGSWAVGGEAAAVEGAYAVEAGFFGDRDQGGVGEVHWDVGVAVHQLLGADQALVALWDDLGGAADEELETCSRSAMDAAEQVDGFGARG